MARVRYEIGKTAYEISSLQGVRCMRLVGACGLAATLSRSANSGNANNSRNVTSTGANNNNNANNANYYAPDFFFSSLYGLMLVPSIIGAKARA